MEILDDLSAAWLREFIRRSKDGACEHGGATQIVQGEDGWFYYNCCGGLFIPTDADPNKNLPVKLRRLLREEDYG